MRPARRSIVLNFRSGVLQAAECRGVTLHVYDTGVTRSLQHDAFAAMPHEFQAFVLTTLGRVNRRRWARDHGPAAALLIVYGAEGVQLAALGDLAVRIVADGEVMPDTVPRLERAPQRVPHIA